MNLFRNPLLEAEASDIYKNNLPEHKSRVDVILHTENKDFYPENVFSLEIMTDYDVLSDNKILTLLMGKKEYRNILLSNRDKLQVTLILNYNGKKISERFKGILLTAPTNEMDSEANIDLNQGVTDGNFMEVEIQCVSMLFSILKHWTTSGVASNISVGDVIYSYLARNMKDVVIDSKKLEPIINLSKVDNERVYRSVVLDDKISILDLPTYLHRKYGVYNGGLGTYVHTVDGKPTISVYPLFTINEANDKMKLVIYLADTAGVSDVINKTTIVKNNELKIIVNTDAIRMDKGDFKDMDTGAGIVSVNSNQVMDRTYNVVDGKLSVSSDNMVDKITTESNNNMKTMKSLSPTDNLYYERGLVLRGKAKILQFQWNFSRTDYLYPNMEVEVVRTKYNEIIREKGILLSHYTKIDNSYLNSSTLLNIMII